MTVRTASAIFLIVFALLLSGCLIESTLNAQGGGTLHIVTRLSDDATLSWARAQVEGPDVKVTGISFDDEHLATYDLQFDDITKISSSKTFAGTTVTVKDGPDGTRTVSAVILHEVMADLPREAIKLYGPDFMLTATLPGPIVQSNATEVKDQTAIWKIPLAEYLAKPRWPFTVTFSRPGSAPTGGTGSASAPTPGM